MLYKYSQTWVVYGLVAVKIARSFWGGGWLKYSETSGKWRVKRLIKRGVGKRQTRERRS